MAAGLHTVRSPGAASSSSCSGYSSHFPLLSSWGHSRVRKAEPNVFSDGPRLDTCRAMRYQGILCSASPTGCSYGAQPSPPVHPTHRHLKEHSAAHVALAPHCALPPHCPPKEEPGRHRHTAGTAGSMQPRRVVGEEGLQPPLHFHSPRHREGQLNDHTRPGHHRLQGWLLTDPGDNKGVGVGGIAEPLNPPQCGSRGQGELHCQVCGLQGDAQSAEDKVEAHLGGTG